LVDFSYFDFSLFFRVTFLFNYDIVLPTFCDSTESMDIRNSLKKPLFQSNVVTSARTDLTRDQRRILYLFLRKTYQSGFPENGYFEFNHKIYSAVFRVGEQEARDDLRKAIKGFRGKVVSFYEAWEGESAELEYDWTTVRRLAPRRGIYSININPELRQHLEPLAYDLNFTGMDLEDLSKLRSKWSLRLYEALCQFRSTGQWSVTLENLRERWELPTSYNKFALLRTRVLDPAIEELRQVASFRTLTMTVRENDRKIKQSLLFHFQPFKD
jgi:plasmid replication initiation protein